MWRSSFFLALLIGCGFTGSPSVCPAQDTAWQVQGGWLPWSVEGEVSAVDAEDFSGISTAPGGAGLMVGDEGREVHRIELDDENKVLRVLEVLTLDNSKGKELDLEAATFDSKSGHFYVLGSHGVSRKTGKISADRQRLFQIPVDPKSGQWQLKKSQHSSLVPLLERDYQLVSVMGQAMSNGGLDMEGLSILEETFLVGLRSPLVQGKALVLQLPVASVFGRNKDIEIIKHELDLEGRGVRDLAPIDGGYLLIAGASNELDEDKGFALYGWQGPGQPARLLTELPAHEGKAEGLQVLEQSPTSLRLLFLFDGAPKGGPAELRLEKP